MVEPLAKVLVKVKLTHLASPLSRKWWCYYSCSWSSCFSFIFRWARNFPCSHKNDLQGNLILWWWTILKWLRFSREAFDLLYIAKSCIQMSSLAKQSCLHIQFHRGILCCSEPLTWLFVRGLVFQRAKWGLVVANLAWLILRVLSLWPPSLCSFIFGGRCKVWLCWTLLCGLLARVLNLQPPSSFSFVFYRAKWGLVVVNDPHGC